MQWLSCPSRCQLLCREGRRAGSHCSMLQELLRRCISCGSSWSKRAAQPCRVRGGKQHNVLRFSKVASWARKSPFRFSSFGYPLPLLKCSLVAKEAAAAGTRCNVFACPKDKPELMCFTQPGLLCRGTWSTPAAAHTHTASRHVLDTEHQLVGTFLGERSIFVNGEGTTSIRRQMTALVICQLPGAEQGLVSSPAFVAVTIQCSHSGAPRPHFSPLSREGETSAPPPSPTL